MVNKNQEQQGDVLFHYIDALPEGVKRVKPKGGRYVLAEGEATGHCHAVMADDKVEVYEDADGTLYMRIKEPVRRTHEEHGKQTMRPGIVEVGRVVEVDPFADEIRVVTD